jgi:citrate lyase subunit beta/citryl-CoA lyase
MEPTGEERSRLRSALFIPGNKTRMLEKAFGVAADAIIPDMEDSVPDGEKINARETIRAFLPKLREIDGLVIPRVNSLATGLAAADLEAVVGPNVDGVSIGKIDTPSDISNVSLIIARLEKNAGLPIGSIKLVPWLETASAIVHCYEICIASNRIIAVAFGAEDFTNDMGIERLDDASQLLYARSAFCTAARAAGVAALETPYFHFRDEPGLREDSLKAKRLGFRGRFAIHPQQIDAINQCFTPTQQEIEQARRIVAAFEEAERRGRGSTSLDGVVIDVPVVKRARALLALVDQ